jgi:hypothetical protein
MNGVLHVFDDRIVFIQVVFSVLNPDCGHAAGRCGFFQFPVALAAAGFGFDL